MKERRKRTLGSFARLTRLLLSVVALMVVLSAGIGESYMWNMHEVQQENNLQSRNTDIEVTENFPDSSLDPNSARTKQVSFKSTGTAASFLRVAVVETWEDSSGAWLPDAGTHATKGWTAEWSSEWEYNDGWYYYKKVLPAGATTNRILNSVTFPAGLDSVYADGKYHLHFIPEVVQVSDEAAVNTSASQTVFGRTATVGGDMTLQNGAVTGGSVVWS